MATVVALTLLNSGVSVAFSYIGRDFWTALSNKDPAQFNVMLQRSSGNPFEMLPLLRGAEHEFYTSLATRLAIPSNVAF